MSRVQDSDKETVVAEVSASRQYWENIRTKAAETGQARISSSSELPRTDLGKLLMETELTSHEIAMMTGVSPAYLSAFKRGMIQKVGREKLLVLLMIAANMSLEETNAVLTDNGYGPVDEFDAKLLIEASLKKTVRGFQTIRSNLSLALLFLSIESLPGDTVLIHKMPDPALVPLEYSSDMGDSDDEVYARLMSHVHRKRIELFDESLERGEKRYSLICEHCLRQHLASYKNEPKEWIIAHLKNTIETLRKYDNFRIDLLSSCQRHWFRIKVLPAGSGENNKLVFAGRSSHPEGETITGAHGPTMENDPAAIRAFATDNKKIYRQFLKELDRLVDKFVLPVDDMPAYLARLVKEEAEIDLN